MGIEYSLRFAGADADRVIALLRRLPGVREAAPPGGSFDLGGEPSGGGWPAATVVVEEGGAYFCDHCGGTGPEHLGVVVAWLVGEFGPVTVDEL
jgi:hypothetical protein